MAPQNSDTLGGSTPRNGPALTPEIFRQVSDTAHKVSNDPDVALIQSLVAEYLSTGPKVAERELISHIGEHFKHVFPAVMHDPRASEALARLSAALQDNRPPFVVELLEANPPAPRDSDGASALSPNNEPVVAEAPYVLYVMGGILATAAGYKILQAIVYHCTSEQPPPGESIEATC